MKFNEKKVVVLLLFGLLLINIFSVFVLAADGNSALDKAVDFNTGLGKAIDFLGLGETWKQVVMGILVFLMLFAAFYDIIQLIGIFNTPWVMLVLSLGLAVAASLIGIVSKIVFFMFTFAAGLGAIGVFLEIVVIFVIFVALSFGSSWAARFAAKRHAMRSSIAAIKGAGDAGAAIKGLKMVQKEFAKNP